MDRWSAVMHIARSRDPREIDSALAGSQAQCSEKRFDLPLHEMVGLRKLAISIVKKTQHYEAMSAINPLS